MEQRAINPGRDNSEPTLEIVQRAAGWLAHLESGDADDADWADFNVWHAEHPAHAVAIDRLGGLGTQLSDGGDVERETLRRLFLRPPRRTGGALLTLVLLVGTGWFASTLPSVQIYFADERTAVGETRSLSLADGSRIVLATDSAADMDHGASRSARLLRGELLAEVARSASDHFVVETPDGTAEALGTSFTVRKEQDATIVTVITSRVRACPAKEGSRNCLTLGPGERAQISNGVVSRLNAVSATDAGAWAEGWLPVEDKPLSEVLAELNRWRSSPIRFDRAALSSLRVSGMFPLRDTDQALANLARSQPIGIDRGDPASPVVRLQRK